jgi:hypothetical protein
MFSKINKKAACNNFAILTFSKKKKLAILIIFSYVTLASQINDLRRICPT